MSTRAAQPPAASQEHRRLQTMTERSLKLHSVKMLRFFHQCSFSWQALTIWSLSIKLSSRKPLNRREGACAWNILRIARFISAYRPRSAQDLEAGGADRTLVQIFVVRRAWFRLKFGLLAISLFEMVTFRYKEQFLYRMKCTPSSLPLVEYVDV